MSLKIVFKSTRGELNKALTAIQKPIAVAAKDAIVDMATTIKTEGRANISSAGFSKKWQNAFRVDTYPRGKTFSINAAAMVYHKIPYADVFEAGAVIHGKPRLWIPLRSTPQRLGRNRMTAALYARAVGPLFPINRPGKPPLLAAKIKTTAKQAARKEIGKVTLSKLRKGAAAKKGVTQAVPLFVGVDSVRLRDRFSLREITDRGANQLSALYARFLTDDE